MNLYDHLLALRNMTRQTTRMARFYRGDEVICETTVTAEECWNYDGFWSTFRLADGPTARRLGATSARYV